MKIDIETSTWLVRLRWSALALGSIALYSNPNPLLIGCGLTLLLSNLIAQRGLTKNGVGLTLLLDILLLTLVLSVTGGPANPFSVLYLVHITLTAAVLGRRWTWIIAGFAVAAFGSLFLFNTASHAHHGSFADHLRGMWLAFALASGLIAYFVGQILSSLDKKKKQVAAMQLALEKNSKFASLVTLSAGAAHELGTPLSTIALITGELARTNSPELKEDIKLLQSEVSRCRKILEEMRFQADSATPEAWEVIDRQRFEISILNDYPDLKLNFSKLNPTCNLPLHGFKKALNCLLSNAQDAELKQGQIELIAEENCNYLIFTVSDQGCGMDEETIKRATEPFYTTKPTGKGMGLGLFLVRNFCEQNGGSLEITSIKDKGSSVSIILPKQGNKKVINV